MSAQSAPPPVLAPADLSRIPREKRVSVWLEMLDAGYKLITAGLAREVGPDGDLRAAYRDWYAGQMIEHDRVLERMLLRMQKRQ